MIQAPLRTIAISFFLLLLTSPASSQNLEAPVDEPMKNEAEDQSKDAKDALEKTVPNTEASVIYVPPRLGHLGRKSIRGGGVRSANLQLPEPLALAPRDHFGHTASSAPTLFWFLDGPTPATAKIEVLLIRVGAIDPLLEMTLPSPESAGIQRIDLSTYEVTLDEKEAYQWAVTLVPDPENRSLDRVSMGGIARRSSAAQDRSPKELAADGLWYDALDALTKELEAKPEDPTLRNMRDSLLIQARLEKAVRTLP